MTRRVRPLYLAGAGFALLAIVFLLLWRVQSDNFLLLPDRAHPVAPLVTVKGGSDPKGPGGVYFVDVIEQRASLLDSIFPGLHQGSSLVPASSILPPGSSVQTERQASLRQMQRSQDVAAAVALRSLGYKVTARPTGVLVDAVLRGSGAAGVLQPTDVIVSLGGKPIRKVAELHAALARYRPGDVVRVGIRRGDKLTTALVKTSPSQSDPKLPALGVFVEQASDIHLPIPVSIDAGNVGGPSAGLAFALGVLEELGHDVDHGYRVAATGELEPDGTVVPIGGVRQKIFGVRKSNVDVFLVPAGDNYRTALRDAHGVRVLPVKNFQQALRELATLPPKA
ncbi:MAG TPA: PDZ domain-containing protein [Gaiellaceae bacterium]